MERKRLEYAIISAANPRDLVKEVNNYMEDGWQPHSSPFIFNNLICQVIVKEKPA